MKKVFVLVHDYWHHDDTIKPMIDRLFDENWDVTFTTDPKEFLDVTPDVFLSFKDPVENDQIPTPIWCDDAWTENFLAKVSDGMGVVAVHAQCTDLPEGHPMLVNIVRGTFLRHPHKCPVTFKPLKDHPVLEGVEEFTFAGPDEQYVMDMQDEPSTTIIAETESEHGTQPAVWVHTYGKGRVVCITPGHLTETLCDAPYMKLVMNAINWSTGE